MKINNTYMVTNYKLWVVFLKEQFLVLSYLLFILSVHLEVR